MDEKIINDLINKIRPIADQIQRVITEIASTSETSNLFWNLIRADLRTQYNNLRVVYETWGAENIGAFYNKEVQDIIARVKQLKVKPVLNVKYREFIGKNINTQSASALIEDFNAVMLIGTETGQKQLNRLIRATQQLNIEEKRINDLIRQGIYDEGATWKASENLQKELLKKAADGKTITIINKNGVPMNYSAEYYAEMVARTKLTEAQSIATINTGMAYGSDLVQVSSHNTTTPICLPYEGKIFSVSGSDKDFPQLPDYPPFHPNCLHTLTVVFRETLERRGIQKYIDYSNGETYVHPTRTSHIPADLRLNEKGGKLFTADQLKASQNPQPIP